MESKKIELYFEKKSNLEIVSKVCDDDPAFIFSLLKLAGCESRPDLINLKFGILHKHKYVSKNQ